LQAPKEEGDEPDKSCGLSSISKLLGKKSECQKIEEDLVRARDHLAELKAKEEGFVATYPMLDELKGLDKFMEQDGHFELEVHILAFLEKNNGSILHTFKDPDNLATNLDMIVKKAASLEQ